MNKKYNILRAVSVVILILSAFLGESFSMSAQRKVSIKVQSRSGSTIAVGESFWLIIDVKNIDAEPNITGSIPGAKTLYTSSSSNYEERVVNGRSVVSASSEYTITLRAKEKGTYSYGPITVGGVKSNKVTYTIGDESSAASSRKQSNNNGNNSGNQDDNSSSSGLQYIGNGNGDLFMVASISKTTAYEQEALVYTVKLYSSYAGIRFLGATAAPKFDGFVMEESKDTSPYLVFEDYKGRQYATAVIARYIIFPQMTGQLKVLGNNYTVSVEEREYYHDQFWGNMSVGHPVQLSVKPNDLQINVIPLPSPRPANFSGGVGKFTISSKLPSSKLKTNQAASIIYTVSGSGNIKYVKLPDLNTIYPPELEVYSPTSTVDAKVGSNNVTGSERFDYSFMPQETGDFKIPAVDLVYFNPETKQYETATAQGYDIVVTKGAASKNSQSSDKVSFDHHLMKVSSLSSELFKRNFVGSTLYWSLYIIPFVVFMVIMILRRRYIRLNSDIVAMRSRKANKEAVKRLKKAASCMRKKDREAFYDEMLAALWGYAGDKLKMPASELSRENLSSQFIENGVSESLITEFVQLVDECEFAKYAPSAASQDMSEIYKKGYDIIKNINDQFKISVVKDETK
jgi:hypothetical protein